MTLHPSDITWAWRCAGWLLATGALVALALAASCELGCAHVRPSFSGGMPGFEAAIVDAPPRHIYDGGAP